ncbi:DUF6366 family protein [Rummeliibacillus pycnus]|uniref:DUF6366 family protein n=1 Tax=Rummeliibacillus pycnus TaxID=101070 RepID=UPI000C9B5F11|nr:DUF6366 family protein [Rummeliibacillus pycnus]
MGSRQEKPEEKRERIRREELKNNPFGTLNDGVNRVGNGNLPDLAGGLGWKGTGILIVVLILGYVLYRLLF